MKHNYKYYEFDNGARLIVDKMDTIESLSVKVLIKVGAKDEHGFDDGISHYIEHVNFKGTKTRTAKDIAEVFDMIGGSLNAYTGRETTVYYAKILKDDAVTAIDVIYDLLANSIYPPEELTREKKVVLQEIKETEDDPGDLVFDEFQKQMFHGQQMGKPILGTPESVNAISRQEVLRYVGQKYKYKDIIIAVCGNFNEEEIYKKIKECFGQGSGDESIHIEGRKYVEIEDNTQYQTNYSNPITMTSPSAEESCKLIDKGQGFCYTGGYVGINKPNIEQVHFLMGFKGVPFQHPDHYAHLVASIIAGGGMSSRLFQEVREKRGLAYSVSAFITNYSNFGSWEFYLASGFQDINEAIEVSVNEIKKMRDIIYENEVLQAKALVKAILLMNQESTNTRAEKIISNYSMFNRFIPFEEILEQIQRVCVHQVKEVMTKIIEESKLNKPTIAAVGNIESIIKYDDILNLLYS